MPLLRNRAQVTRSRKGLAAGIASQCLPASQCSTFSSDNRCMFASARPHHLGVLFLLVVACSACVAAYAPGLHGIFLFDDHRNLEPLGFDGGIDSREDAVRFVTTNRSGRLGRPVSMASFLLNDNGWPSDAFSFKYTNLMLHLLCGLLVFLFCRSLGSMAGALPARANGVAAFCTTLWLLHPLHVSTVLYVIQRMTQLSALFTLAGLLCFLAGRRRLADSPVAGIALMVAAMVPFGLLAAFSKENGILICAYIVVIETAMNHGAPRPRLHRVYLGGFVAAPLALLATYIASRWPSVLQAYEAREFTLAERLLTQPRVLMDYLRLIFAYRPWGTGLFHEDFPVSRSLLQPWTTLVACTAVIGLLAVAVALRRRAPVATFAVLWFFAGHALESTVIPLELYFEHRNYLPMLGPLFAVAWYATTTIGTASDAVGRGLMGTGLAAAAVLFATMLASSAHTWSDPNLLIPSWEVENPTSGRAKRSAATYFNAAGDPTTAVRLLRDAVALIPSDFGAHVSAIDIACTSGLPLPWRIDDLAADPARFRIRDGTAVSLERLTEHVSNADCAELTLEDLNALYSTIEKSPDRPKQGGRIARILFLHADVYKAQGDLNGTMLMLEQTWDVQATPSVALTAASVLHSAGLDAATRLWLDRARQADARRRFGTPSRLQEIDAYERRTLSEAPAEPQPHLLSGANRQTE